MNEFWDYVMDGGHVMYAVDKDNIIAVGTAQVTEN
jgi:hypothetical protein